MGIEDQAPAIEQKRHPSTKYQYWDVKIFGVIAIIIILAVTIGLSVWAARKDKDPPTEITTTQAPSTTSTYLSGELDEPVAVNKHNVTVPKTVSEQFVEELEAAAQKAGVAAPEVSVTDFSNWDGSVTVKDVLTVAPESLAQLAVVVKAINALKLKHKDGEGPLRMVRASGGGYSYSNLFAEEGQLKVDSSKLVVRDDGSPAIKMDGSRLSVLAGMTIAQLVESLVELQLQIPSLPTIINAQVGGAIATGSHGGKSTISEYVYGVTMVNGDGDIVSYNEDDVPEAMSALRCCVGMCGIFYEIIFNVESITYVAESSHWEPARDVYTPDRVNSMLAEGAFLGHWAGLSGLTAEEWETYSKTGVIPANYDPFNDIVWFQKKVPTAEPSRRRRRSVRSLPFVGAALQSEHLLRHKRQTTEEGEATAEPAPEPAPEIDNSLTLHKYLYEVELNRTTSDNNTVASYPESLAAYNATGAMVIQEVGFTLLDNTSLTRSLQFIEMVYSAIQNSVLNEKKLPLLTLVNRWLKPSTNCYLCPNHYPMLYGDDTLVFTMSFTTFMYKPGYQAWINELFPRLSATFPDMRVRWAYADSRVNGILQHIKSSLGADLTSFQKERKKFGENLFLNSFVSALE